MAVRLKEWCCKVRKMLTSERVPVDDDAVHAAGDDHFEQRVVEDLGDGARVREPVRVVRVELLVQHQSGDADGRQDVLARRRVVHRRNGCALTHLRWHVDVRLNHTLIEYLHH
jgi:hypothetical protein